MRGAKRTSVNFCETGRTEELRGKSVTGNEAGTGVNSSWAKKRNPTARIELQRTQPAARKTLDRLQLMILIRLQFLSLATTTVYYLDEGF
jgi:hypothetical protein